MITYGQNIGDLKPLIPSRSSPRRHVRQGGLLSRQNPPASSPARPIVAGDAGVSAEPRRGPSGNRREFVLLPSLAMAMGFLHSTATAARADEKAPDASPVTIAAGDVKEKKEKRDDGDSAILSRVYDATVIGEPLAVGKDKGRVWEKLMEARVVYLGEAELVPERDDRVLELEIVRNLWTRCLEQQRPLSLALEAFPCNLQEQLNQFMDGRIDGGSLRSYTTHWPPQRWQEYEPLLNYCRDNGLKLVACGTPLEVLRTVQAEGIRGLSMAERKIYSPPAGSGFISGFTSISGRSLIDKISSDHSIPFGPSSYLSAQARVVDDYTMSQIITQAITDGGSEGMLVVVTGASHVIYGSRGIGIPARISKKLLKKNQAVILLDPERQDIRREGEIPVADILWYSAAKPCSRNCFDRAEIARVMNAAGRRREALPQDLQKGLDLGIVSPEILQNFFDLEQYPLIAELIHRFQGFRERLLADPKFLNRLATEEAISITTTLLAQYERRKGRFLEEIDYVLTDTIRGSVVDFFTVWLPAPTLSFLTYADNSSSTENLELLKGLIGSFPDNAFQKNAVGMDWNLSQRFASVLFGGLKLAGVGFISSIGAGAASDVFYAIRQYLKPAFTVNGRRKRSPILKSAFVYGCFLGTSANLRYQIIAGLVEHRLSDSLLSYYNEPLLVNMLSFVVRTINSFWGTQQWVDLARFTGLQRRKGEVVTNQVSDTPDIPLLECSSTKVNNIDDNSNQSDHHMEATSQENRGPDQNKRDWSVQEDLKLIEAMLDLHNMGTYNADNLFKSGFFNALEKILAVSLPQSRFKADPHIRSRVKSLKGHFAFVHDMLCGPNTSRFGYDDTTKSMVAEKSVWDAYILSHKKAAMFKEKPFQYHRELCIIFGKERATDVHAETIVDVVEELEREAAMVTSTDDDDFDMLGDGIDTMDFGTSPDPASFDNTSDVGSSRRKRKKKIDKSVEEITFEIVEHSTAIMIAQMDKMTDKISKALQDGEVQDMRRKVNSKLAKVVGLTIAERLRALIKIACDRAIITVFFTLEDEDKDEWVRSIID